MLCTLGKWILCACLCAAFQCRADCETCAGHSKLGSEQITQAQLFILVSLGIPEQSLKLWAEQASKVQAPLLIRGFVENSILKTTQKISEIFGETPPELLVDPERFETFKVQAVPAVVLMVSQEAFSAQESEPIFEMVYGDTSLEEALMFIHRQSDNATLRQEAARFLEQIRGNHD